MAEKLNANFNVNPDSKLPSSEELLAGQLKDAAFDNLLKVLRKTRPELDVAELQKTTDPENLESIKSTLGDYLDGKIPVKSVDEFSVGEIEHLLAAALTLRNSNLQNGNENDATIYDDKISELTEALSGLTGRPKESFNFDNKATPGNAPESILPESAPKTPAAPERRNLGPAIEELKNSVLNQIQESKSNLSFTDIAENTFQNFNVPIGGMRSAVTRNLHDVIDGLVREGALKVNEADSARNGSYIPRTFSMPGNQEKETERTPAPPEKPAGPTESVKTEDSIKTEGSKPLEDSAASESIETDQKRTETVETKEETTKTSDHNLAKTMESESSPKRRSPKTLAEALENEEAPQEGVKIEDIPVTGTTNIETEKGSEPPSDETERSPSDRFRDHFSEAVAEAARVPNEESPNVSREETPSGVIAQTNETSSVEPPEETNDTNKTPHVLYTHGDEEGPGTPEIGGQITEEIPPSAPRQGKLASPSLSASYNSETVEVPAFLRYNAPLSHENPAQSPILDKKYQTGPGGDGGSPDDIKNRADQTSEIDTPTFFRQMQEEERLRRGISDNNLENSSGESHPEKTAAEEVKEILDTYENNLDERNVYLDELAEKRNLSTENLAALIKNAVAERNGPSVAREEAKRAKTEIFKERAEEDERRGTDLVKKVSKEEHDRHGHKAYAERLKAETPAPATNQNAPETKLEEANLNNLRKSLVSAESQFKNLTKQEQLQAEKFLKTRPILLGGILRKYLEDPSENARVEAVMEIRRRGLDERTSQYLLDREAKRIEYSKAWQEYKKDEAKETAISRRTTIEKPAAPATAGRLETAPNSRQELPPFTPSGKRFFGRLFEKITGSKIAEKIVERFSLWTGKPLQKYYEGRLQKWERRHEEEVAKRNNILDKAGKIRDDMIKYEDLLRGMGKSMSESRRQSIENEISGLESQAAEFSFKINGLADKVSRIKSSKEHYDKVIETNRDKIVACLQEKIDSNAGAIAICENQISELASKNEASAAEKADIRSQIERILELKNSTDSVEIRQGLSDEFSALSSRETRLGDAIIANAAQSKKLSDNLARLTHENAVLANKRQKLENKYSNPVPTAPDTNPPQPPVESSETVSSDTEEEQTIPEKKHATGQDLIGLWNDTVAKSNPAIQILPNPKSKKLEAEFTSEAQVKNWFNLFLKNKKFNIMPEEQKKILLDSFMANVKF